MWGKIKIDLVLIPIIRGCIHIDNSKSITKQIYLGNSLGRVMANCDKKTLDGTEISYICDTVTLICGHRL